MSVSIEVITPVRDEQNSEYNAAVTLKSLLENSFKDNDNGTICITSGLTLCGQEVRDIDLFVFGKLDNYVLPAYYTNSPQYPKKNLIVDGFCIAIELKEHPINGISYKNTHVLVQYNGKWKDATQQNEKQKYSCVSYFSNAVGYNIFMANFIWLKSISPSQFDDLFGVNRIGALPADFSFIDLLDVIIAQSSKPYYDNIARCYRLCPNMENDFFEDIKRILLDSTSNEMNELTRKKLEILTQRNISQSLRQSSIGKKLTIFKGRAGTGKTFRLIQSALQLANPDTGKRGLLLTYNHALVADIRRLLHFMEIPDGIDSYTVQIKTLHSFFIDLMTTFGVNTNAIFGINFEKKYNKSIEILLESITTRIDERNVKTLKDDPEMAIDWDYILVDEAQDWSEAEKQILLLVYGEEHIIVADGVDQFVRSNKRLIWGNSNSCIEEINSGLRQKSNLVNFVKRLANELDVPWNLRPNGDPNWSGGQIIITRNYTTSLHRELVEICKKAKCDNYDMLFLVPPGLVSSTDAGTSHFKMIDLWEENGITVFDGTNSSKRHQYATKTEECRLYQYDSCRGLEGWVTVCIEFDEFTQYKHAQAKKMQFAEGLAMESQEDKIQRFVNQWALIPLTRPIDTLVITLKNPESEIGKCLHQVASACSDYVSWMFD